MAAHKKPHGRSAGKRLNTTLERALSDKKGMRRRLALLRRLQPGLVELFVNVGKQLGLSRLERAQWRELFKELTLQYTIYKGAAITGKLPKEHPGWKPPLSFALNYRGNRINFTRSQFGWAAEEVSQAPKGTVMPQGVLRRFKVSEDGGRLVFRELDPLRNVLAERAVGKPLRRAKAGA